MEIRIQDKILVVKDGNNTWNLDQFDLQEPLFKSPQGYILFKFRSTKNNKGTYEIRIYPNDVSFPDHNGLDDLHITLSSWWNLAQRRRAFDDVTEQFDDLTQIIATYPVGVEGLLVGNNHTETLWGWFTDRWVNIYIPNKLGFYYQNTLSTQYIAYGGETYIQLSELVDAKIIQVTKETQPLATAEYSFDFTNGRITLVNTLTEYEKVFIIYTTRRNIPTPPTPIPPVKDYEIINFTDNSMPSITNYNRDYAFYGQYPTTILVVIQEGIQQVNQATPTRNLVAGLLDSIVYDLGGQPSTGFIILKR